MLIDRFYVHSNFFWKNFKDMSPLITISLQQGAEKKTPKTVHHLEIFLVLLILKDPYKAHKVRLNFRKPMNIYPWKDVFLTCQAISTMGNFLHKNSCYGLPCTRKRVFCYFKNKTREYLAQLEMKHNLVKLK